MGWMGLPQLIAVAWFALLTFTAFVCAHRRAGVVARECPANVMHSRPVYHGLSVVLQQVVPCALAYISALILLPACSPLRAMPLTFLTMVVTCLWVVMAIRRIVPTLRARTNVERVVMVLLKLAALLSIGITGAIVFSVFSESMHFFSQISFFDFISGLQWSPQMAMRADQAASSGAFGAVPLFIGTALIMLVAMVVAIPMGLFSAIYMSEYATARQRNLIKPLLELLAGIPTVVYGFFAIITVAPLLKSAGAMVGLSIASESALTAGMVMGIMIIPFVSSMADDVMRAVPLRLREASLGLGATRSETVCRVILPAALPGIMGGILLAISRAIGETMIVVMAAGLSANLTFNPLEAVTTVTVQIVTLLVGDQEFDSPKTLAAFALGLTLFVFTLAMNMLAQAIVRRYREHYE